MKTFPIALIVSVVSFIGIMICNHNSPVFPHLVTGYATAMIILIGTSVQYHFTSKGEN